VLSCRSLWDSCRWATVPICLVIAFLLLGIEEIGGERLRAHDVQGTRGRVGGGQRGVVRSLLIANSRCCLDRVAQLLTATHTHVLVARCSGY
jgi:hypothetical protein